MPTIRHLQVKGGELITEVDDPYAIGYGTQHLLELEASKHPSALENLPPMDNDPDFDVPYVVSPKRKPKHQGNDAWKLGCVLTIGAILAVIAVVMRLLSN